MMFTRIWRLILFAWIPMALQAVEDPSCILIRDLALVDAINRDLNYPFPVFYNHTLSGGYFSMPSARMGNEGEIGLGFGELKAYRHYNLRLQLLNWVELSGSYRIFKGVDDPILSPSGFGDKSDKGANIKFSVIHPEDSQFLLPGIAFGFEDFIGTKSFEAGYLVFTQVMPQWNLECSIGYGKKRFRGWFGGFNWLPFYSGENPYLKYLAIVGEYDAIAYTSPECEPHPKGRSQRSRFNWGIKQRMWNCFDLSASYIKGTEFAYSLSAFYNFGMTHGFFPKVEDPFRYSKPTITTPLGPLRSTDALVQDLLHPFQEQGFTIRNLWLSTDRCGRNLLRINLSNEIWRYEDTVRQRLYNLLANLIPSNIDEVAVVLLNETWPVQEYRFPMEYLRMYENRDICPFELLVLSPMKEAGKRPCNASRLFKRIPDWWNLELFPKTYTAFGSAKGKFKYLVGVHLGLNGYLRNEWYYSLLFGYSLFSNLGDVSSIDRLNPSQIINVRTDTIYYFKTERCTVDEAYLQKWWNMGKGWYSTLAAGLFEEAYGGIAGEILYYPADSCWAVGIDGAYLRKRTYSGVGFSDQVRKLEGYVPTYKKYHGSQYFTDLYYHLEALGVDFHIKAGKFLAHDWGVRSECSRYYPSGMRLYFWFTYTDARDYVNGSRYYDHGAGFTMPLDIFLTRSSRDLWGYGMSAWLRDVGAISAAGLPLYDQIRSNRERSISRLSRSIW